MEQEAVLAEGKRSAQRAGPSYKQVRPEWGLGKPEEGMMGMDWRSTEQRAGAGVGGEVARGWDHQPEVASAAGWKLTLVPRSFLPMT